MEGEPRLRPGYESGLNEAVGPCSRCGEILTPHEVCLICEPADPGVDQDDLFNSEPTDD